MIPQEKQVIDKELRRFGQLVGTVLVAIGLWPLVQGEGMRLWAFLVGGTLCVLGSVVPRSLSHLYHFWVGLGHALAWINTRIILGIIFFVLITPMGLSMRVFGKQLLYKTCDRTMSTYRVVRVSRARRHFRYQF